METTCSPERRQTPTEKHGVLTQKIVLFTDTAVRAPNVTLLAASFMLVSCLAYSSMLKMEASCYSETSVDFQRAKRRYITEDRTLQYHHCGHLKSHSPAEIFSHTTKLQHSEKIHTIQELATSIVRSKNHINGISLSEINSQTRLFCFFLYQYNLSSTIKSFLNCSNFTIYDIGKGKAKLSLCVTN
jgi:hypothetical protein